MRREKRERRKPDHMVEHYVRHCTPARVPALVNLTTYFLKAATPLSRCSLDNAFFSSLAA